MTIDVSKLKAGDVVLVELTVTVNNKKEGHVLFSREPHTHHHIFTYAQLSEGIKEILPAPFDWKDAKPGMAFIFKESDETVYYSGPDPFNKKYVICAADGISPSGAYRMSDLIPAPEHDIEVPE